MATRKGSSAEQAKEIIGVINEISTKQQPLVNKEKVPMRTVAVRINEEDYKRLDALFAMQATNMASAGRAALFYLADEVESGRMAISHGVIHKTKGR
jgi:hypothetical protein